MKQIKKRILLFLHMNMIEKNELHNRYLHLSGYLKTEKVDIEAHKVYNRNEKFGFNEIFGRSAIVELLGLQNSCAFKLISKLVQAGIIEPVSGYGKGKQDVS